MATTHWFPFGPRNKSNKNKPKHVEERNPTFGECIKILGFFICLMKSNPWVFFGSIPLSLQLPPEMFGRRNGVLAAEPEPRHGAF